MRSRTLVVGIAQVRQSADMRANLAQIAEFVEMARRAGARIVCFPECALTGYGPVHHASSAGLDPEAVEAAVTQVKKMARTARMAIVVGAHLPLEGGWSNSVLLIDSRSRLVTRYDKAHLYGRDAEFYRAGRARPSVAKVAGVRVGLQICFDIRFPEPFRTLSLEGAQLIFVPSHIHGKADMWKGPVIEAHVRSRAAENGRFVAFANAAGPDQNVPSMVADPRGELIGRCRRKARQLLVARIDLKKVNDEFLMCRRKDLFAQCGSSKRC